MERTLDRVGSFCKKYNNKYILYRFKEAVEIDPEKKAKYEMLTDVFYTAYVSCLVDLRESRVKLQKVCRLSHLNKNALVCPHVTREN